MTSYKTCAVPMCRNTTIKYPDKLFIHVPRCPKRRKQWLQLACRDPAFTSDKSTLFFCEDHFDLPNDMENYIQYSVMGSIGQIRMKPDCLPLKFQCQPYRIKCTAPPQPRAAVIKRLRMDVIQEIMSKETDMPVTSGMTSNSDFPSATGKDECSNFQDQAQQVFPDANGNDDHHIGFTCNNCSGEIRGYRYTCVQCPDYDMCFACEAKGAHNLHYVLRIPSPKPPAEIQSVLKKIRSELYGMEDRTDAQPTDIAEEAEIKAEIKEELPDPLSDADDGLENIANHTEADDIPQTASKEITKSIQILNVNSATTTESSHGNTLLIIENPVSTGSVASPSTVLVLPLAGNTKRKHGSVASPSTPLPSYTKRKHGAIKNVPAATIDKRIKLEPQEPQASNIGTGTYIDVPITGYVPVTTVPGTVGTSDVSAGMSDIDSAEEDDARETSFQVLTRTKDEPRKYSGKRSISSRSKKKSDCTNK